MMYLADGYSDKTNRPLFVKNSG